MDARVVTDERPSVVEGGPSYLGVSRPDQVDELDLIEQRIAPVNKVRLGAALYQVRTACRMSRRDAALMSDLSAEVLESVESGRRRPDARTVQRLLLAYGAHVDQLLPQRQTLVVTNGTDAEVLSRYLAGVKEWRSAKAGEKLRFREADIRVLTAILGADAPSIEAQLIKLTGCSRRRARRFRLMVVTGIAAFPLVLAATQGVASGATLATSHSPSAPSASISTAPASAATR